METPGSTAKAAPRSFVLKARNSDVLEPLLRDVQRLMLPNTADKLKQTKSNKMKDFVQVAGQYQISHFLILSQTKHGANLRIARMPRGPTLYFNIQKYSLIKDVQSIQKRPNSFSEKEFNTSPLVVLNNMSGVEKHVQLMSIMFQNLFPSIQVQTIQLSQAKRIILFCYNGEDGTVDVRHYSISIKNRVGLSRSIKTVLKNSAPSLQSYEDISEFVLNNATGYTSETDMEELGPDNTVSVSSAALQEHQRAVKLFEIGPRMSLKLMKIQEGFCDGPIIYHSYVQKTKEQVKELSAKKKKDADEKAKRKQEQEANVERKKKVKKTKLTKEQENDEEIVKEEKDEDDEEEEEEKEEEEDDELGQ